VSDGREFASDIVERPEQMMPAAKIIVWVWRDCEPLPFDSNNPRLMRAGMLCAALAERGHQVRWFNSTFDHYQKRKRDQAPGSYPISEGLKVELVEGLGYGSNGSARRLLHNALVAQRFARRAREIRRSTGERPDVIVADLPMPDSALAAVRLARAWSIPSVVSVRDLWPDFFTSFLGPAKRWLAKPFIANLDRTVKAACSGADHLIGISSGYLAWALQKAGRAKRKGDSIAPLGYAPPKLEADEANLAALRAKGIDPDKDLATFIGSWGRTYDLELLLAAAARLQSVDDLQFVIAGKGEQGTAFTQAARKLPNVVLPGWLDRAEIAALLERSSVALAPYSSDAPQGLPNKLFEYMAAGLYQVTTLRSEAREVLEVSAAGAVVDAADPEAFAQAIRAAIPIGKDRRRRSKIKAYFAAHFDAQKVYSDYAATLERIATEHDEPGH
jgi:glycosyltransferase involved in cell wall biosynthesis